MKPSLLFTLFLILSYFSQAQVKLNHIAVYVENLAESKSFYSDIIGLEEIEEPFKDGLHVWYKLGSSQLHLIEGEWENPSVNKNNHLCFSIEDMGRFIENLQAQEIEYENWIGEAGKITQRVDGVQQIYFTDPNGYWIEVNNDFD
jgi:catechol 2,3-dioxygenase-like lactoylglutathione lyase family enzyme